MIPGIKWVGFSYPVRVADGEQATTAYAEVLPVPAHVMEHLRLSHGRAICDLTPSATHADVPFLPRRAVEWWPA